MISIIVSLGSKIICILQNINYHNIYYNEIQVCKEI